jgi:ATP-dependent Lon protease
MTMNVAALSDVMAFTGTHPTYSNPKPSVIVDYMARHEIANPCIILDEIDKSPEGGRNGSIKNVLLQFLEPGEARTFRDICLNAEVDLSRVRWVMTANVLERVPLPLRSRCQIVHVPSPDRKHAIGLSRQMAEAILTEMGLDRRWITFDGVEEVLLQEHFRGDLRHLRMMVDLFIRERLTSLTMC